MIPVTCMVKTDLEAGTYGDCVRACIASIVELPSENVPHFYADPEQLGATVLQEWLRERGEIIGGIPLPGNMTKDEVLHYMLINYPTHYYMLWCSSGGGDHAVVGRADKIEHDPAWYRCAIDGPQSMGYWLVWIIAKL